jgi:nucleoside-diphosphate-sugar epimerase
MRDSAVKIVVTGAAGFIGSQLSWHLHQQGFDVHLLDNLRHGYRENLLVCGEPFGTFHEMDIRDADLSRVFAGADTVFHLAAISALPVCQSQPMETIDVNVSGTANVLEAGRKAGVRRIVFASTSAIYENNEQFPCREDDNTHPTLLYAMSKKQAEILCHGFSETYGMEIVITRYYNVYGPQQDIHRKSPPFVGYVIRELLAGRVPILHSNGEQRRDYVFVGDVNELNIACMSHPSATNHTFNVASGNTYSVNELFTQIAAILGSNLQPVFRPSARFWELYPELFEGKFPLSEQRLDEEVNKFTLGSTFHAKHVLGWHAKTTMADGLEATVNHVQSLMSKV